MPPGIAKKRGDGDEDWLRTVTNTVYVTNPAPSTPNVSEEPPPAPTTQQLKVDLDNHAPSPSTHSMIKTLRVALAWPPYPGKPASSGGEIAGAAPGASEYRHRRVGDGVNVIFSGKPGKPAGNYMDQHAEGKSWARIAADNNAEARRFGTPRWQEWKKPCATRSRLNNNAVMGARIFARLVSPALNTRARSKPERFSSFGDRGRPARTGRRLADQIERTDIAPNGSVSSRAGAIGGTPMAATGTVAIPFSTESFRLRAFTEKPHRPSHHKLDF